MAERLPTGVTMLSMHRSGIGQAHWRVILIQIAILAGLALFYLLYLNYRQRGSTATAEREEKIEAFFESTVTEDRFSKPEASATGGSAPAMPQKLLSAPSVDDVRQSLGLPDEQRADAQGGLHLAWIGTKHKLEASFEAGRLYCLRREDRATGHGVMVYESSAHWRQY